MKKLFGLFGIFVLLATMVTATGDSLTPKDISMAKVDTTTVQYCIDGHSPAAGVVPIVVIKVCKDVNGVSGCQAADIANPAVFDVTVMGDITTVAGAGCTDVKLETNIVNPSDAGLFYYTVGDGIEKGQEGAVVAETGSVEIPEFATIGAALALAGAGLYIFKKRK